MTAVKSAVRVSKVWLRMRKDQTIKSRGRPRSFDVDTALAAALRLFWTHGYEGTSLDQLTEAMGINRPSLYAAFGNKETLFRRAVDLYSAEGDQVVREALAEPTARAVVRKLLTVPLCPLRERLGRGCMLVQSALACGPAAEPIQRELAERRQTVEHALRLRFEQAKRDGDLAPESDPAAVAKFVATFAHGLAVQDASNADRQALLAAVEVALNAVGPAPLPEKGRRRPVAARPRAR